MITHSQILASSQNIFPAPLIDIMGGISSDLDRYYREKAERPITIGRPATRNMSEASVALQQRIYDIIKERGKIGSTAISKILLCTRFTVYSHCNTMVNQGKVKLVKQGKIFYWAVV